MQKIMQKIQNPDLGILLIRIVIGLAFIHAGWLKINNLDMVVGFFGSMGIPAFLAYLVSFCEFVGGILIIVGVFTQYVAVILGIIMIVATFMVHVPKGYGLANGGYEYTLALLLSCVAVLVLGSGKYAVSKMFKKKDINPVM